MERVGQDGVITVEEGKGMKDELDVVEGMQFDRGYLSPYFVTNQEKMEVVLENPFILIVEKKISSMKSILTCSWSKLQNLVVHCSLLLKMLKAKHLQHWLLTDCVACSMSPL